MSGDNERFNDYTYKEYRYKDTDSKQGYDVILKYKDTKSLLPPAILNKFSFDNFVNYLRGDIQDGDNSIPLTINLPTIQSLENGRSALRQAIFDENTTSTTETGLLQKYYDALNKEILNPNNDLYVGYMIGIAKLVVEYFMYSSIVYGIMYNGDNSSVEKPSIIVSGDSTSNLNVDLEVYVNAMFDVEGELNMTNDVYHAYVADNINFNKMYVKNNNLLKDKESSFNQRKSHLITMMSKNKKIKKQYANRSFWHMIYLIVLIIYILTLVGITYAGRSNLSVFSSLQKETMGMVLIIISSMVLLGMFLYGIFRRFFKN